MYKRFFVHLEKLLILKCCISILSAFNERFKERKSCVFSSSHLCYRLSANDTIEIHWKESIIVFFLNVNDGWSLNIPNVTSQAYFSTEQDVDAKTWSACQLVSYSIRRQTEEKGRNIKKRKYSPKKGKCLCLFILLTIIHL